MTYMTPQERVQRREEIQSHTEQYLSRGGVIKQLPAGAQAGSLEGISYSEISKKEAKARMIELGLPLNSKLPERANTQRAGRKRSTQGNKTDL